jgi:hypothetical protein
MTMVLGLLLCLYVVACNIQWLCTFFLGFWLCFGPKSIDSSLLSAVVIVVVVSILFVSFWCLSSHLQFPSFFLHWYWIVPIDCMADCNYDSDPSVWLTDWFWLLSSSLLLLQFIVVLRSFVTSFVFNHGITSYCLPNGLLLLIPSWCCFLYYQLSWALI